MVQRWRCRRITGVWAGLLVAAVAACGAADAPGVEAQAPVASAQPGAAMTTAFVGVTVVPMDSERTLDDQTVVVEGTRITAMGAAGEVTVPAGAQVIDGPGRYLIPGLAEMHGHLPNPNTSADVTENVLFLYVANGVTTVRGMQGHPAQLALRERVRDGELVGPQLVLGSPAMGGNNVATVEDAERLVREYAAAGFGCLRHSLLIRPRFVVRTATRTSAAQLCQALCAGRSRECARPPQEGVERDRAP